MPHTGSWNACAGQEKPVGRKGSNIQTQPGRFNTFRPWDPIFADEGCSPPHRDAGPPPGAHGRECGRGLRAVQRRLPDVFFSRIAGVFRSLAMLVDSHAHLTQKQLSRDLDGVLSRARAAGVSVVLTVGTDLGDGRRCIEIASSRPGVYAAAGLHPHDASAWGPACRDELKAMAESGRIVAVGETGLDYHRDLSPRKAQIEAFEGQLAIAASSGLPAIIHCREAYEDCISVLEAAAVPRRGVVHCYSGGHAEAERILALGFFLSFTASLTYAASVELREVAQRAPADRIMVETDAPFLAPKKLKVRFNEPALVVYTAAALAEIRGSAPSEIEAVTSANAARLFGLRLPGGPEAGLGDGLAR